MTCVHCGRTIVKVDGRWVDPAATGDDAVWRETCDAHDSFVADHEPDLDDDHRFDPEPKAYWDSVKAAADDG